LPPDSNVIKIVGVPIVTIILMITISTLKIISLLKEKILNRFLYDSIKDVPVENLDVQKNIVNAIKQVFYVEIFANVWTVKIMNV
jgi:hypothetical protein